MQYPVVTTHTASKLCVLAKIVKIHTLEAVNRKEVSNQRYIPFPALGWLHWRYQTRDLSLSVLESLG